MKKLTLLIIVLTAIFSFGANAQFDTGVDIYSSYVWRGTKFGSGPAMQPWLEYSKGGFSIGAWGSYCFTSNEAMEADLYASYGFDLGESSSLNFTVTDYYFPESEYFDGASHFFEPMANLGLGSFSFTAAYMLGAEETDVSDMYFEAGLSLGSFDLTLGAGDGAYTVDGDFGICNIGLSTSKEISITDSFSIPVSGAVILNPSSEVFHIVVGISL
ncbi:MAG: hypothetical protein JXR31_16280 [Prolixibacteraceae bacterium]|nr:hypothetical protein [Prolixibacteraceae bacterium]